MKVKNWLKNNTHDFSVKDNDNNTIISSDDVLFLLRTKYGKFEMPEEEVEDNDYLYDSYRNMVKNKIIALANTIEMVNTYDPITDSEVETITTTYGSEVSELGSLSENTTVTNDLTFTNSEENSSEQTNNLATTNTGTDNRALSNTKTDRSQPMAGSGGTITRSTITDTGSDNETVNLASSNTGTVGIEGSISSEQTNTGTVGTVKSNSDSKTTEKTGEDVILKEKEWTNNNLYNDLIKNKFDYNTKFSLIDYYVIGFKNLVMYVNNDIWG